MFVGHGSYAVEHDKDIIVFIAKGAWNVEASRNAIALISRYADRLTPQEFAIVADTREVEGITPQSADVWSEAVREWLDKGHIALARVDNPESLHYKIFLARFDEFAKSKQRFKVADSVEEALEWLNKIGFQGFEHDLPKPKFLDGLENQ